ncbi:MAG: outer membrane lipoprotein-sorting protein [Acidobacteriota bacterium]
MRIRTPRSCIPACWISLWLTAVCGAAQDTSALTAEELVRRIDRLYRADTSWARVEMQIVTPDWRRTLVMEVWTEGLEKALIRILEPARERGVGTLRIGSDMWNYLPKVNKIIRVPPSMMMSSWMGSDFTNDDLVKEYTFLEDYRFAFADPPEDADPDLVYIECIPREGLPVVWSSVLVAVKRESLLPVWQRYFDEKGRLFRTMVYGEERRFGDRVLPSRLEMIPETKPGRKTVVRYLELKFGVKHPPDLFSLRTLREGVR